MSSTAPSHVDRYRSLLHDVMDMAADIARAIHREATAPHAKPGPDIANAFDRVARIIRRCIALAQRLDAPVRPEATRRAVIRAAEDAIHRHADPDEAGELHAELYERLDRPEFAEDLDRPLEDVITEIIRDLGLAAIPGMNDPWKRRTPADIATLHARAAALGNAPPRPAKGHPTPGRVPPH
jgi:hypothetical protein